MRGSSARVSPVTVAEPTTRSAQRARRLLPDGWLALINEGPSGDVDSDLRVALLALLGGGDRRRAADFLRQSADKKMESVAASEPIGQSGQAASSATVVQRSAILNRESPANGRIGGLPRHGRRFAPKAL